jgi:hypothetical protein
MAGSKMNKFMKQNINRPIRSATSQVIAICAILTGLGICVIGVDIIINGLITGRIYSPTVSGFSTKMIYKETSPDAYWTCVGFYSMCCVGGLTAVILTLREVVIEHKRKVAAKEEKAAAEKK